LCWTWPRYLPEEGDERLEHQKQTLLKPRNFTDAGKLAINATQVTDNKDGSNLVQEIREHSRSDTTVQEVLRALQDKETYSKLLPLGECSERDGLLYVNNQLYVPDNDLLRLDTIRSCHDHILAGHPGRAKTLELLTRTFFWPGIRRFTNRYVRNCQVCARAKAPRHAPYGYLKSLEVPQRRWQSISMDFITGLPVSEGYDSILVVVDRLSKMAHFLPVHTSMTALDLAKVLIRHVWKLHGSPEDIISDRGSLFTSSFWKTLCEQLRIKRSPSTAFHPETDGQTERVNAILEQYLRAYCNYSQDNWADLLATAEFMYNNTESETTKMTPFFANYGYHPTPTVPVPTRGSEEQGPVQDFSERLRELEENLQSEMKYSQMVQSEQANHRRLATPRLEVRSQVWLLRKNIRTTRPSAKLDYKRLGPFTIKKRLSSHAYELVLPDTMKVHPVFHVSLLAPIATDPIPGQLAKPAPPVIVDGQEEHEVEEILDSRRSRNRIHYLVKWTGYHDPTWEPLQNVTHCHELLQTFHNRYPRKPRPSLRAIEDNSLEGEGTVTNLVT
jgi:transposase InsO family protein